MEFLVRTLVGAVAAQIEHEIAESIEWLQIT